MCSRELGEWLYALEMQVSDTWDMWHIWGHRVGGRGVTSFARSCSVWELNSKALQPCPRHPWGNLVKLDSAERSRGTWILKQILEAWIGLFLFYLPVCSCAGRRIWGIQNFIQTCCLVKKKKNPEFLCCIANTRLQFEFPVALWALPF